MITSKFGKKLRYVKSFFKWTAILAVLYVIYVVGFIYFTRAIPMQPSSLSSSPHGVVVFTGTRARLQEGFETLRRYPDSHLLISGVNRGTSVRHLLNVSRASCCPPVDRVTLDYHAQDTIQNAIETAKWAKENNLDHLCLITSNYHMPRSLLELSHYAPQLEITPHPVVAKSFQNDTWWRDKEVITTVFEEYNKFLVAWIRFQLEPYFT